MLLLCGDTAPSIRDSGPEPASTSFQTGCRVRYTFENLWDDQIPELLTHRKLCQRSDSNPRRQAATNKLLTTQPSGLSLSPSLPLSPSLSHSLYLPLSISPSLSLSVSLSLSLSLYLSVSVCLSLSLSLSLSHTHSFSLSQFLPRFV